MLNVQFPHNANLTHAPIVSMSQCPLGAGGIVREDATFDLKKVPISPCHLP